MQRRVQSRPRRVEPDPRQTDIRALDHQRRRHRKGRRARVARHGDRLRHQLRLAAQRDHPPLGGLFGADGGAEAPQHPLGMVPRRLLLDHHRLARCIQAGEQHGGLDLRRGHRRGVLHRHRVRRPGHGDRQPPATPTPRLGTEERQGLGDTPHRPSAEARIAGEGRGDVGRRHRAHDQPHPGTGVAVVDHVLRLAEAAHADPLDPPGTRARPLDGGAEGAHRPAGIEHVLPLEKAADARSRPRPVRPRSAPGARSTCPRAPRPGRSAAPTPRPASVSPRHAPPLEPPTRLC